jgi:hypothetical protein
MFGTAGLGIDAPFSTKRTASQKQKVDINPKKLKMGDGGKANPKQIADVKALQQKLMDLKLLKTDTMVPTGYFGSLTQKALDAYNGTGSVVTSKEKVDPKDKGKTKTTPAQRYYETKYESVETNYLKVIEQFYEEYTQYLSKGNNMGKFVSLKNTTLNEMNNLVSEANKAKDKNETDKIMKKAVGKIQKSYAILSNAEFGYIFAKHNMQIKKILKKKMILSLYALATGRGFIIFKGKRFKMGDIYAEDLKTPRYVKVGN